MTLNGNDIQSQDYFDILSKFELLSNIIDIKKN